MKDPGERGTTSKSARLMRIDLTDVKPGYFLISVEYAHPYGITTSSLIRIQVDCGLRERDVDCFQSCRRRQELGQHGRSHELFLDANNEWMMVYLGNAARSISTILLMSRFHEALFQRHAEPRLPGALPFGGDKNGLRFADVNGYLS
jgi:hypothetical protein